ncbi:MAG: hypothetical protein HY270_18315 [Deltaproteobacteria bacterium]|nr:hypothetical protein [Deltaproteobacteria bacterium]
MRVAVAVGVITNARVACALAGAVAAGRGNDGSGVGVLRTTGFEVGGGTSEELPAVAVGVGDPWW